MNAVEEGEGEGEEEVLVLIFLHVSMIEINKINKEGTIQEQILLNFFLL